MNQAIRRLAQPRLCRPLFWIYALSLATATHWPDLSVGQPQIGQDKIIHVVVFAGWTVLLAFSRLLGDPARPAALLRVSLAAVIYAAIDEATQAIPGLGRTPSVYDLMANVAGVLLATIGLGVAARRGRVSDSGKTQTSPQLRAAARKAPARK